MSKPTYLHQSYYKSIVDDKVVEHEESIIDGPKGLTFKLFHREGDKKEKIIGRRDQDGKVKIKIMKGDEVSEEEMDLAEFKKFVKKEKSLKFAEEYVSGLKGGKMRSRKASKKSSKKRSRKGTRGHSRPKARRGSKKSSRKTSRRSRKHH